MQCHLSGAIPGPLADTILPPKLDVNVGARSHFFQPPSTSSATNSLRLSNSSLFLRDSNGYPSLKRPRHDSFLSDQPTPRNTNLNGWPNLDPEPCSTAGTPYTTSPAPLVNAQYRLAGGLDTPTAAIAAASDEYSVSRRSSDLGYRTGEAWSPVDGTEPDGYFPHTPLALMRDGNGRSRRRDSRRTPNGWGKAVFTAVGGVAGKVWDFCKFSTFRGFYAGGGPGYPMTGPTPRHVSTQSSIWSDVEAKDDVFGAEKVEQGLIPGGFPEEDFIPDYMSQDHTITRPRPAKKIYCEKAEGDLTASWIMVGRTSAHRERSPSRLATRKTPAASSPGPRPPPSASRRKILPVSRPSMTSYAGSPALRSNRPASSASTRSPVTTLKSESPVSAEAQRYAARIRRKEAEEDANLQRLNKQLQTMIKEGKHALGTKFEVEVEIDEVIDEGFSEGHYSHHERRW
ncbi:hypothetical protein MMC20_001965 [Loxospora ochrophaea]|nr:hypothetical protein [Loxospora ochrophaea]